MAIIKTFAELDKDKQKLRDQFKNKDLLVCNYETIVDPEVREVLHELKLEYIYADEIHYIKSPKAGRTKALWEFGDVPYRFGSTATAITNNPEDIYSIYKFVKPGLFKTLSSFRSVYIKYNGYGRAGGWKNKNHLKNLIEPYFIAPPVDEVNSELPDQVVIPRYARFSPVQKDMHAILMSELDELKKEEQKLIARLKPRDMVGHPELDKLSGNIMARQTFAQFLADDERLLQMSDSEMAKKYITGSESHKLSVFKGILAEVIESGEKVAVFTRYERMQRLLEEAVKETYKSTKIAGKIAKINGKMNSKKRFEEVYDKFRDDDAYQVLLMTDAGAEGLNLSSCKYMIEFEPADSYKTQTQRRGRNQRSDSIHDTVYVYQLITQDSWDEIGLKIVDKKEAYHHDLTN